MFKASEAISYDWTNVFRCTLYYFNWSGFKAKVALHNKEICFFRNTRFGQNGDNMCSVLALVTRAISNENYKGFIMTTNQVCWPQTKHNNSRHPLTLKSGFRCRMKRTFEVCNEMFMFFPILYNMKDFKNVRGPMKLVKYQQVSRMLRPR